jgi:hypothetical protein
MSFLAICCLSFWENLAFTIGLIGSMLLQIFRDYYYLSISNRVITILALLEQCHIVCPWWWWVTVFPYFPKCPVLLPCHLVPSGSRAHPMTLQEVMTSACRCSPCQQSWHAAALVRRCSGRMMVACLTRELPPERASRPHMGFWWLLKDN